jgi:hypothetical protein
MPATESLGALQTTLAGEHAAVWVYGVLGGQASPSADPRLYDDVDAAYRTHRGRRDQLIRTITDHGGEAVASETAYQLPNDASTPARMAACARVTERGCAATYADLVARTTDAQRGWAIRALTDAAVRQLRFRGSPETFPGAGELTDH